MILTRRHPELGDALFHELMEGHEKAYSEGREINRKSSQGVNECHIGGTDYMVKCYSAPSITSCVRMLLGRSRVDTSFRYAQILNDNGVPAARHLLCVKHLSAHGRAYLVMEKAPGMSLFEYIQPDTNLRLSDASMEAIARHVTSLHKLGIAHGDLHTRNLIIAEDDSVKLIDFDNARKSAKGIRRDLKRFRDALSVTSSYEPPITAAMKRLNHPFLT